MEIQNVLHAKHTWNQIFPRDLAKILIAQTDKENSWTVTAKIAQTSQPFHLMEDHVSFQHARRTVLSQRKDTAKSAHNIKELMMEEEIVLHAHHLELKFFKWMDTAKLVRNIRELTNLRDSVSKIYAVNYSNWQLPVLAKNVMITLVQTFKI